VEKGQYFTAVPGTTGVRLDFAPVFSRALRPRHILDGALSIDMFGDFGCAVTRDHELACWQSSYAFGTKEADPELLGGAAVEWVEGVKGAVQVAVGLRHTCVRHEDGSVSCFGDPEDGAVGSSGQASDEFGLTRVKLKGEAKHLMAGALHTCAATDPPQVVCWGYGGRGGIGRGATEHRGYGPAPVVAPPLPAAW
jgi:alpha-tubulin suppressor-like RCC1 family protein